MPMVSMPPRGLTNRRSHGPGGRRSDAPAWCGSVKPVAMKGHIALRARSSHGAQSRHLMAYAQIGPPERGKAAAPGGAKRTKNDKPLNRCGKAEVAPGKFL